MLAAGLALVALNPARADTSYQIRAAGWSPADERGFGEFITAIGRSGCRSVDACLNSPANPFRASNPRGFVFRADCADLPYVLRFYYAWKRGLPFSWVSDVSPNGRARDIRYTAGGNRVAARRTLRPGADALRVLQDLRDSVSSATYRLHPDMEDGDFYSPALGPRAIHPGTVIYDPNGHLALVFAIEADGRIRYIDSHPDNSLTRGFYDLRFVRASPGMGAGFKNWRPVRNGRLARNSEIADFSTAQYFGTGPRPADSDWKSGRFVLNGQGLDYYDYLRASLSGGKLEFDPVQEVADMVKSNCDDLHYRADAVVAGLEAGLQNRTPPDRLPPNIYGTEGSWEDFSTPSRDARLKVAFQNLRGEAQRFVEMGRAGDARLLYRGRDLVGDMLAAYDGAARACRIDYVNSDGRTISLDYETARQRLFAMSFDPYQCVERRWGASGGELASCRDGGSKRAWYEAEQRLRNQTDRTYEARMDFSLDDLQAGRGGVAEAPDTDARRYLLAQRR